MRTTSGVYRRGLDGLISLSALLAADPSLSHIISDHLDASPSLCGRERHRQSHVFVGWLATAAGGWSVNLPERATSLKTPLISADQSSPGVLLDLARAVQALLVLSVIRSPVFSYLA